MKTTLVSILLGVLALSAAPLLAALQNDGSRIPPGIHTDSVEIGIILKDGDWRMNLANDCLTEMFKSGGDGGTAQVLRVLSVTGFALSKVTLKEVSEDPGRMRFGFEFANPGQLKTVYWEADCPVTPSEAERASR